MCHFSQNLCLIDGVIRRGYWYDDQFVPVFRQFSGIFFELHDLDDTSNVIEGVTVVGSVVRGEEGCFVVGHTFVLKK